MLHLEYRIQAWAPYLKKDIATQEKVQTSATKLVLKLMKSPYDSRLRMLNLYPLKHRWLRGLVNTICAIYGEGSRLSRLRMANEIKCDNEWGAAVAARRIVFCSAVYGVLLHILAFLDLNFTRTCQFLCSASDKVSTVLTRYPTVRASV